MDNQDNNNFSQSTEKEEINDPSSTDELLTQSSDQPQQEESEREKTIRLLERQLRDSKERYIHSLADKDNEKKRIERELQRASKKKIEQALADFLTPLDQLEQAIRIAQTIASSEVKNWVLGFEMICTQFKEALEKQQIFAYSSQGERFDPNLHEATEVVETDEVEEGIIVEEFIKGYTSESGVLRPARVKVAKKPVKEHIEENKKERSHDRTKEEK